jgi:hypothetical protein
MQKERQGNFEARKLKSILPMQLRNFKVDTNVKNILKQVAIMKQLHEVLTMNPSVCEGLGGTDVCGNMQRFIKLLKECTFDDVVLGCFNVMGKEWVAGFANSFLKLNTTAATSFASQILGQADSSAAQENDGEALAPFANRSTEVWEAWKRNGQLKGLKNLRPQFYKILLAPRRLIPDAIWIPLLVKEIGDESEELKSFLSVDSVPNVPTVHETYMRELEVSFHPLSLTGGVDWNKVVKWRQLGQERLMEALRGYPLFFAPSSDSSESLESKRFEKLSAAFANVVVDNQTWAQQVEEAMSDRSELIHLLVPMCEYEVGWERHWNILQAELQTPGASPTTTPHASPRRSRPTVQVEQTVKEDLCHELADAVFWLTTSNDMPPDQFTALVRRVVIWMMDSKSDLDASIVQKFRSELN